MTSDESIRRLDDLGRKVLNSFWRIDPDAYFAMISEIDTCAVCGLEEKTWRCSACGHDKRFGGTSHE